MLFAVYFIKSHSTRLMPIEIIAQRTGRYGQIS